MDSPALASSSAFAPKLFSGVELIDRAWGGLYRGGSYLLYGRAASGRDLMTLRFAQTGAEHGESCLFVSPARPKDLMIQAASIGFDLRHAYENGTVKLMRIPPTLAADGGDEDEALLRGLRDLVALVRQHRPSRLVIGDFMPFVLFRSEARFRAAFLEMLEHTDVLDMTTLLVMSEPANAQSKKVIDFMGEHMTGTVHVEMPENDADSSKRRLTLTPRIGHLRKRLVELWDVNDLLDEPSAAYPTPPAPRALEAPAAAPAAAPAEDAVPPPTPEPMAHQALSPLERFEAPAPTATRGIRRGRTLADLTGTLDHADAAPAPAMPAAPAMPVPAMPAVPDALPPFVVETPSAPAPAPLEAPPAAYAPPAEEPARWSDMPAPVAPIVAPVIAPDPASFTPAPFAPADFAPPAPPAPTAPAAPALFVLDPRLDRDAFETRLQQHFALHAHDGTPFLLVAMRLDRSASVLNPFNFDFVSDVVSDALRPTDDLLVDPASERLVVLLPGSDGDAFSAFITRVKQRLREDAPQQAEELLRAISAIAVANGRMFGSAQEFLAYALDKP